MLRLSGPAVRAAAQRRVVACRSGTTGTPHHPRVTRRGLLHPRARGGGAALLRPLAQAQASGSTPTSATTATTNGAATAAATAQRHQAEAAPTADAAAAANTAAAAAAAAAAANEPDAMPTTAFAPLPQVPYADVLLVQTFGWVSHRADGAGRSFWCRLADLAPELAALGATHAWLPPPSASVSPEGYLPGQLYDLNSAYGSPRELRECCAALRAAGVRPCADIVINHRCADRQDGEGRWNVYEDARGRSAGDARPGGGESTVGDGGGAARGGRTTIDWGRWAITGDDPHFGGRGNPDSGADFEGAPDLDHHNAGLRAALVDWLRWLREDFGFDSWRLDFAKGYCPTYAGEYIRETLPRGSFCVGELWCDLRWDGEGRPCEDQDAARQSLCDWVDGCRSSGGDAAAFDFVTKGVLQAALETGELWRLRGGCGCGKNKPPGMAGWWPQRAVSFVDNHDTGSAQQHWPCPARCLQAAYAYILTHPSIPCLFGEHVLDAPNGEDPLRGAIEALLRARRACGISADSALEILKAEQDLYVADVTGSRKTARVKLGAAMDMGELLPKQEQGGWALAASGEGFAVWTRDNVPASTR